MRFRRRRRIVRRGRRRRSRVGRPMRIGYRM